MIVTCSSCRTRFRLPRDKVGPRGARIRCSSCHAIFVVRPEGEGAGEAKPAAATEALPPAPPAPAAPAPVPAPAAVAIPRLDDGLGPGGARLDAVPEDDDPFAPKPSAPAPWNPTPDSRAVPADVDADPFAFAAAHRFAPADIPDPFAPTDDGAAAPPASSPAAPAWDPFGVVSQGSEPEAPAPPTPARSTAPELLEGPSASPPRALIETGSLALEEREPAPHGPSASSASRFEEPSPELDFGGPGFAQGPLGLEFGGTQASAPEQSGAGAVATDPPWTLGLPEPAPAQQPVSAPAAPPPAGSAPIAPRAPIAPTVADHALPAEHEPDPGAPSAPDRIAARRRARRLAMLTNSLSLLLLVGAAVGLFLAWRGGLPSRLGGALARPAPLVEALGVTGGLYETAAGSAVLVVRGHVQARADVDGPVRVQVQLTQDGRVVATEATLAGAGATPEQVYGAGAPASAAELRRELDRSAAATWKAGRAAPFLVVFSPPIPDPRRLQLRVSAAPASEPR